MQTSPTFKYFTLLFHQDLHLDCKDEKEALDFIVPSFRGVDAVQLREDLDHILQSGLSDEELKKLWWASDADFVFSDGATVRRLLEETRKRL